MSKAEFLLPGSGGNVIRVNEILEDLALVKLDLESICIRAGGQAWWVDYATHDRNTNVSCTNGRLAGQ